MTSQREIEENSKLVQKIQAILGYTPDMDESSTHFIFYCNNTDTQLERISYDSVVYDQGMPTVFVKKFTKNVFDYWAIWLQVSMATIGITIIYYTYTILLMIKNLS
jgi:hypothetical protein